MLSEIWRDFDPNLDIPAGLKNAKYVKQPDATYLPDPDADIDIQDETLGDEDSDTNEDQNDDELAVPSDFTIISQTVRTAANGQQVVDVVIDVTEVDGAVSYEVRMTK